MKYMECDGTGVKGMKESLREDIWGKKWPNKCIDNEGLYQPEADGYKVSRITVGNDFLLSAFF